MWRVPVVQENLAAGRSVRYGAAVIAVWTRCAEGIGEAVAPVEVGGRLGDRQRQGLVVASAVCVDSDLLDGPEVGLR